MENLILFFSMFKFIDNLLPKMNKKLLKTIRKLVKSRIWKTIKILPVGIDNCMEKYTHLNQFYPGSQFFNNLVQNILQSKITKNLNIFSINLQKPHIFSQSKSYKAMLPDFLKSSQLH